MAKTKKEPNSESIKIKHDGCTIGPTMGRYRNGSVAVDFLIIKNGDPYISLSTNLNNQLQDEKTIFVNQSGAHLEIADMLVENKLIVPIGEFAESGFNYYQAYKLSENFLQRSNRYQF